MTEPASCAAPGPAAPGPAAPGPAAPGLAAAAPARAAGTAPATRGSPAGQAAPARWLLPLILAAQAALSLALLPRPVVQDEATYIDAGNAEISHWLHGAHILPYPQVFSGAPVIYPPLSAAVAGAGGLAAARLVSLCLMLSVTALLWSTARRLLGGMVPVYAAALFAATAATQYLGALATFDALALLLLAAAAWCAARAGGAAPRLRFALLAAVCLLLLAANATKYASALWDPVIVAMAGLAEARHRGWRAGLASGAVTGAGTLALFAAAAAAAGPAYQKGIMFSTLDRTAGNGTPAATVLAASGRWTGLIAVLALAGSVLLSRRSRQPPLRALAWVLTAAVFLAPLNQARIGVMVSLFKHVGFGAWFAAIPAGYAAATAAAALAARGSRARTWAAAATVAGLAAVAAAGAYQVRQEVRQLPMLYSQSAVARLRPLLQATSRPLLADSPTVIIYYAHTPAARWKSTYGFSYTDPRTHRVLRRTAAYTDAIRHHYFGIVVLRSGRLGNPVDKAIVAALRSQRGYRLLVIPESPHGTAKMLVWRLGPASFSHAKRSGQGFPGSSRQHRARHPAPGARARKSRAPHLRRRRAVVLGVVT